MRPLAMLVVFSLACQKQEPAAVPPAGPTLPATLYVHASSAKLRERPEEQATVVDRLDIGAAVVVTEMGPTWARVSGPHSSGWVGKEVLGSDPPTLEWALSRHDALPLDDVTGRRQWAERAAALAPDDVGVLERLLRALEAAKDAKAAQKAKSGLEDLRQRLRAAAIAGIVVDKEAAARAQPNIDSDLVDKLEAGDLVRVLRDSADSGGTTFVAVLAKGKKAWMQTSAVLVPEVHHLYNNQIVNTYERHESWTPAPQASALGRSEVLDGLVQGEDPAARRLVATALFARINEELTALGGRDWFECGNVAALWATYQRDSDLEVRTIANQGLLDLPAEYLPCILQQPPVIEGLGKRLAGKKKLDPVEKTQLEAVINGVRGHVAEAEVQKLSAALSEL